MTALIVIVAVLVVAGVAFAVTRARGPRLREETLGNPEPRRDTPLVRPESRHNDTPAGADLDRRSGRHDD